MSKLRRYFLTGLVVVIPLSLTLYVLFVAFQFIDNILGSFLQAYLKKTWGFYIPGIGFIILLLVILTAGALATRFLGHRIFINFEKWFSNLPLVKNIYPAVKQVILFVSAQKHFGFKKVVLVEYPSRGIWSLGFLTGEEYAQLNRVTAKDMVSVFIPTTPGPLSGFVIFVAKEDVKFPDISVNAALNIIISGGVFNPKN